MINILTALEWYTHFDKSHLKPGPDVDDLTDAISSKLDDENMSEIESTLERVLGQNFKSDDIRPRCEALVKIAILKYKHGQFEIAKPLLQKAAGLLTGDYDIFRLAAVRWMLGMVQFSMKDDHQGFVNWDLARKTYKKQADLTDGYPSSEIREWFSSQVWLMNLDLARIPAGALEWANDKDFEGHPTTSDAAKENINKIYSLIDSRNFGKANEIINKLAALEINTSDDLEKWDIELTCGVCYHMMNEPEKALNAMKTVRKYAPQNTLPRAVASWIMGTIDWQAGDQNTKGISSWQKASEEFQELQNNAKKYYREGLDQWYQNLSSLLQEILQKQLEDKYPF